MELRNLKHSLKQKLQLYFITSIQTNISYYNRRKQNNVKEKKTLIKNMQSDLTKLVATVK